MINWPDDLVEDIGRRRSVLFLGAGISKNAQNDKGERPKNWEEFLSSAAASVADTAKKHEIQACLKDKDLLTACELVKKYLQADVFKAKLLEEYSDKGFGSGDVHDDISHLDSRYVLTTNFDKLYENRANEIQNNTVLVKNYYDRDVADVLRRRQRCVLKIHGTIDSPERTIFTRSAYAQARTEHGHFYRLLEALLLTHTFIFLGASMRDPDIQLLLEDQAFRFSGTRPHYMIMPNDGASTAVLEIIEESMNLRTLLYDPTDNHSELADSLSDLRELVATKRETLTQTLDW
jgi:hypothetical protein